jgi:hypothetical protein
VEVPSGQQQVLCVVLPVADSEPFIAGRVVSTRSAAEDLTLVLRTTDAVRTDPYDCRNDLPGTTGDRLLFVFAAATDELTLPEGAGATFAPGENVKLQVSFAPRSAVPHAASASVELFETRIPKREELSTTLTFSTHLDSPSENSWSLGPAALGAGRLLALGGHMHSQVRTRARVTASSGTLFDETDLPARARIAHLSPPAMLDSLGSLTFSCETDGRGSDPGTFDFAVNNTGHCFFWLHHTVPTAPAACIDVGASVLCQ